MSEQNVSTFLEITGAVLLRRRNKRNVHLWEERIEFVEYM